MRYHVCEESGATWDVGGRGEGRLKGEAKEGEKTDQDRPGEKGTGRGGTGHRVITPQTLNHIEFARNKVLLVNFGPQ